MKVSVFFLIIFFVAVAALMAFVIVQGAQSNKENVFIRLNCEPTDLYFTGGIGNKRVYDCSKAEGR